MAAAAPQATPKGFNVDDFCDTYGLALVAAAEQGAVREGEASDHGANQAPPEQVALVEKCTQLAYDKLLKDQKFTEAQQNALKQNIARVVQQVLSEA